MNGKISKHCMKALNWDVIRKHDTEGQWKLVHKTQTWINYTNLEWGWRNNKSWDDLLVFSYWGKPGMPFLAGSDANLTDILCICG